MTTNTQVAKWLEITEAQRVREITSIKVRYGEQAAMVIAEDLAALRAYRAHLLGQAPNTPLEAAIEEEKKKAGR